MSIRREIEVTRKGLPRPIDVTFGTNMLPLEFVITDFELPEGVKVEAYAIGVSKKLVKQSCEVSGNVISFTPEIGLFEEGKNMLQLAAKCDGKELFSFYIPVICQKTMFYEGAQNLEEDPTFLGMVMQMKQDVGELSEETLPLLRLNGCIVCNGEEITLTVGTDVEVGQVILFKYKKSKGYSVSARGTSIYDTVKQPVAEDGYSEGIFTIVEGYATCKFTGAYFVVVRDLSEQIVYYKNYVTPQMFGAVGDGTTDDTVAMQSAFDEVAKNGKYLFIPKGRYKVTSPITIDWSSTSATKRNFLQKIIGAGSQAFEKYYDNSVIVGFNIPAYRGVIELIGNGNTWGTETRIEDLGIECDESTCDPMSFALMYGDARNFKMSRVKLRGHNGIYARCGSIVDENGDSATKGYEQMNVKFEQCDIYSFEDNTKGFAFLPEGVVTEHYAVMDNILVDSCLISGVWVINSVNIMFQSCHTLIRNVENKLITTDNVGLLNGYEIDYATGYYIGQAMSAVFQNCYFEDYRRGIQITPTIGNIRNVSIMNCYLNPGCNQFKSDGSRLCADYGIRINSGMSGKEVRNVLVQNNVFRLVEGDTEYVVANVSNEFANHFVFKDNCTTSTQEVPKVVNTTTKGYDIQNGLDSGASVKSMTTSADGKTLTIELTNGQSITFNTGASAPVKGVDYFTEAEIEEITANASELAKAGLEQIPPPTWVESTDDMTDTSKHYVLLETGNIWAYMTKTKTTAGSRVPNFTNLMDDPNAYAKNGYRYSNSSGAFKAQATDCAIVVPIPSADSYTIRVRGASMDGCSYPGSVYFSDSNETFTATLPNANAFSYGDDENGDAKLTITQLPTTQYSYMVFHVGDVADTESLIVTINEEITYTDIPASTEKVTEWTDTGHNIAKS